MDNTKMNMDDGIFDPMGLDEDTPQSNYVPKFERDLAAAGGNLKSLSEAKKAEASANNNDDIITDDIDLSSLNPEKEPEEYTAKEEYIPTKEETYAGSGHHTRSIADFAREAEEEAERLRREEEEERLRHEDHNLDGVKVSEDMLSDMNYSSKKKTSETLRNQMQLDELAMEMNGKPKIEEMSTVYTPTKKKSGDLTDKDMLDRNEKQLIKERLENEIGKRPENYNKKQSLEMYHALMREQKVKKAKKGFFTLLILIVLGIFTAVLTYFKLNWNESSDLLLYASFGAAAFSVLLLIKAKPFKMFSCVYFAINTLILIGPGFVKFAMNADQELTSYVETLIFFVVAIVMSAIVCVRLATSENIDAYFTTSIFSEKDNGKGKRR